jgi:hypothetical protein
MSLKFLAVGRTFAGSPRDKSPFALKEGVLPTFENAPRFSARQPVAVQTDWLAEKESRAVGKREFGTDGQRKSRRDGKVRSRGKRNWLQVLTLGILGKPKLSRELVQGEMSLEKVQVTRNDLADSDLEVVVKKTNVKMAVVLKKVEEKPATRKTKSDKRSEWTELTARLFQIGQH